MRILAADQFLPAAVEAHEVAEASGFRIEGVLQEAEIAVGERRQRPVVRQDALGHQRHDQRPGVVVRAVAVVAVGDGETRVLEHARIVGHDVEVI